MQVKTIILNGKTVSFQPTTEFHVQVGKGAKGSYKTVKTVTGNAFEAVSEYNVLGIPAGAKKRLYIPAEAIALASATL